jgi:hypothetical protein
LPPLNVSPANANWKKQDIASSSITDPMGEKQSLTSTFIS